MDCRSTNDSVCINDSLTDDDLRAVLAKLQNDKDKESFGLVCKRWLHLQSTERKKLCARAGPLMLRKMAARFSRLVELDLSQSISRSFYPGITDSDLSVIATGFRSLRILNLKNCKGVTDVGMKVLGDGLQNLQNLNVSNCRKLTDKGLISISKNCINLKVLDLTNCKFITNDLLQSLSGNCSYLEELVLEGCIKINDSGLLSLVERCRQIKFLDLSKCNKISDVGIIGLAKACSLLKTLKLLDCVQVGNESISLLSERCWHLETIVIGGCRTISDESIKGLAFNCSDSLKNLRMDWCSKISDFSLSFILSRCKKLETLDIGCCDQVTDATFHGLTTGEFVSVLKVLKASNCPRITISGIGLILESCKSLEYLDVRSCPHITEIGCSQAGLKFPASCKVNFTGSLIMEAIH